MPDAGSIPHADPLAYFLTWPTYGTWLPGDTRGWILRSHGWQPPDPIKVVEATARMSEAACRLSPQQRAIVEKTIAEHCGQRAWTLHAVNCRTNHVHVVVTAPEHPRIVREQFKAWCTRRLKDLQKQTAPYGPAVEIRAGWWAERGSNRYINDMASLEAAICYVRHSQDAQR